MPCDADRKTGKDETILISLPEDGTCGNAGRLIEENLRKERGLRVLKTAGGIPSGAKARLTIALGCMADNRIIRRHYFRFSTLVDRWYPGKGGFVLQSITRKGENKPPVIIAGGSNPEGVSAAAEELIKLFREKKDSTGEWVLRVELGREHINRPPDRMNCFPIGDALTDNPAIPAAPEERAPGYAGGPVRDYLLKLGMYGPHADNGHFSRSSQLGLRFLYTGEIPNDGKRYRDMLMHEIRTGIVENLYHYKSLRMFQLWETLEESPLFSPEDKSIVNDSLKSYLVDGPPARNLGSMASDANSRNLMNRHLACDALNLYVGSDYFYRSTGESRWLRYRGIADRYFRMHENADVPLTGLTEGYFSYLEIILDWMLNSCPGEIKNSPQVRLMAERCIGLCTNRGFMAPGAQSDEKRYGYNLLRKLAYLLDDGRYLFAANLRERAVSGGVDRVNQFSAGQAWSGDTVPEEPRDSLGFKIFPLNERSRKCVAPNIPKSRGFDRAAGRSGWGINDEYFNIAGIRGAAKTLPNAGSLSNYERFGAEHITSPAKNLLAAENSPWNYSVVTVTHDKHADKINSGAVIMGKWIIDGIVFLKVKTDRAGICDWQRTFCWKMNQFLLISDKVVFSDEGDFTVSANWHCAGRIQFAGKRAFSESISPGGLHSSFWVETFPAFFRLDNMASDSLETLPGADEKQTSVLHAMLHGRAQKGESRNIHTLLHSVENSSSHEYSLGGSDEAVIVRGRDKSWILSGLATRCAPQVSLEKNGSPSASPEKKNHSNTCGGRPAPTKTSVAAAWKISSRDCLPGPEKHFAFIEEDGCCSLFKEDRFLWRKKLSSPATALCWFGHDILAGAQSGEICRLDREGRAVWRHKCGFRPEKNFWPWWFLQEPSVGALAAGTDKHSGNSYVAAGTGSSSLAFLDPETGCLIENPLSQFGFPDRVIPHRIAGTEELRFFAAHSRLASSSSVTSWPVPGAGKPPTAFCALCGEEDLRRPGWDSCGAAGFRIIPYGKNNEAVVVLRYGLFNQICAYDIKTAKPLWMRNTGGLPIALAIDRAGEKPRITVADRFGWVAVYSNSGELLFSRRMLESILGLARDSKGRVLIWNEAEMLAAETNGYFKKSQIPGRPVCWVAGKHFEGLLVSSKSRSEVLFPK